jgi:hypothetical protein
VAGEVDAVEQRCQRAFAVRHHRQLQPGGAQALQRRHHAGQLPAPQVLDQVVLPDLLGDLVQAGRRRGRTSQVKHAPEKPGATGGGRPRTRLLGPVVMGKLRADGALGGIDGRGIDHQALLGGDGRDAAAVVRDQGKPGIDQHGPGGWDEQRVGPC